MNLFEKMLLLSTLLCLATAGSGEEDDPIGWIGGPGTEDGVEMANPAATYCTNQGYRYSDGRCVFPDGSSCDAWDLLSGRLQLQPRAVEADRDAKPRLRLLQGPGVHLRHQD
ncbi:DUF333 domain-containing protein [Methanothrix harundinacea]|uniref:DUF333 domain-containing protein n=1 Tax=Methanothrix harundinacea TaxID=301375 RepID=UPI0009D9A369|nr:DUF333 domain-containing protein [Methanothrix harundinacea]